MARWLLGGRSEQLPMMKPLLLHCAHHIHSQDAGGVAHFQGAVDVEADEDCHLVCLPVGVGPRPGARPGRGGVAVGWVRRVPAGAGAALGDGVRVGRGVGV